jgi:hypothetical protein
MPGKVNTRNVTLYASYKLVYIMPNQNTNLLLRMGLSEEGKHAKFK